MKKTNKSPITGSGDFNSKRVNHILSEFFTSYCLIAYSPDGNRLVLAKSGTQQELDSLSKGLELVSNRLNYELNSGERQSED